MESNGRSLEATIKAGWTAVKTDFVDPVVRRIRAKDSMEFDIIYNPDRDNRPGNKSSGQPTGCVLCKNCVEDGPVLWSSEKYKAVPNAFPIVRYHTLLVLDKFCPDAAAQGKLGVQDLQEALSFSEASGQRLIYNTFGAAATQPHQHFQGFSDYDAPVGKLRKIAYSKDGRVQSMPDYPGVNFIFYGKDKLPMVESLLGKIRAEEYAYTLLIQGEQVTVLPRRQQGEIPACTDKRIGGLECSGGFVIGKIPQKGEIPEVPGEKIFFKLSHDDLKGALRDSMLSWDKVSNWYDMSRSTSHYFSAAKEPVGVQVGVR